MNGLTYLILAIISEVIATTVLKSIRWLFSRLYPSIVVVVGYCFFFLGAISSCESQMPLGIAYAILERD